MIIECILAVILLCWLAYNEIMSKRRRPVTGGSIRPTSYMIVGEYAADYIAERLSKWKREPLYARYADVIIAMGNSHDRRLYPVRARIKCRMDSADLTDKAKFHAAIAEIRPDLIAETFQYSLGGPLPPGVWMMRSGWGWGGRAAEVATNTADADALVARFNDANPTRKPNVVIASKYISSPMLYHGRKFHLRVYMIASVVNGECSASMLRESLLIPAALPYADGDWNNKEIHDTHGKGNADIVIFPSAASDLAPASIPVSDLADRVIDALRACQPVIERIKPYSEAPHGYELLGADIMFDVDGRAIILEINDEPGLTWTETHRDGERFQRAIVDMILSEAVARVYPALTAVNDAVEKLF